MGRVALLGAVLLLVPDWVIAQTVSALDVDYNGAIEYADDKDRLDVFMPLGAQNAPVLVYFHGGALMFGDKSLGQIVAERLMPLGVGVVSANYRLSPAVQHPAHVQDAAAATAWVISNIARYGGDPSRVFVAGHSAGAYLAALLALDESHLATHGVDGSVLAGAIAISPFLYVEETAQVRPTAVWGEDPAQWLKASVTPHIAAGKVPMLLIYADGDDPWRRAQNERFGNAMRAAGNHDVQVVQVPDRDHASLVAEITADDDAIGDLVVAFTSGGAATTTTRGAPASTSPD